MVSKRPAMYVPQLGLPDPTTYEVIAKRKNREVFRRITVIFPSLSSPIEEEGKKDLEKDKKEKERWKEAPES